MSAIHPTAIVSPNAKIGNNILISPYVVIEDDVEIGDDCWIGPHTVIYNGARIGQRVKIHQSVSVANVPQDLKFGNDITYFYIGDDTVVREFATLHRGTNATGFSKVGKKCLLMAYTHIAHDCVIGNNCILANNVQMGGHCHIEDWVIIGGMTGIHQFSNIGQHAMIGAAGQVASDVPPYILTGRDPFKFAGLNVIGLRRRGFSNEDISTIKEAYRLLYLSGMNFGQAKEKIEAELGEHPMVKNILNFINNSKRGILRK
ncbi:MAG: acyl-ACP--UDP-N-acetylglucosamine O-acyltransferase [bacterium]